MEQHEQDIWLSIFCLQATGVPLNMLRLFWRQAFFSSCKFLLEFFVEVCGMVGPWTLDASTLFRKFCKLQDLQKRTSCQTGVFLGGFPGWCLCLFWGCKHGFWRFSSSKHRNFCVRGPQCSDSNKVAKADGFLSLCFGKLWESKWYLCPNLKMAASKYNGPNFGALGPTPFITRSPNLAPTDPWVDLPSELCTAEKISGSMMQYDKHGLYRQAIRGHSSFKLIFFWPAFWLFVWISCMISWIYPPRFTVANEG